MLHINDNMLTASSICCNLQDTHINQHLRYSHARGHGFKSKKMQTIEKFEIENESERIF